MGPRLRDDVSAPRPMTTPMDRLSRKARTQLFIGKIEQRYSAGT
jgi:hypothetical protein